MLGHLGLNVTDTDLARDYYGKLMPLLGYEPFSTEEPAVAFAPAEGRRGAYLFLYAATEAGHYARDRPGLQHLAFTVPTRGAVREVHAHVLRVGSHVLHAPQE